MLLMFEIYFIIMIFINIDIISNVKMLDLIRFITYRGDDIIDDVVLVDRDDWDDLDYDRSWIKNN